MSYDISARCDKCGHYAASWSPTYNYANMFRALGIDPRDWHGKLARDYSEALGAAFVKLRDNLPEYRQYDAPNGWGTADMLLPCLEEMAHTFASCGNFTVEVS